MNLADLTLDRWCALDLPTARRVARQAAEATGGRLVAVERSDGDRCPRARIDWQGREFALVPGVSVRPVLEV
ncbi:hypothetical protein [Kitasatospora sp. NPDC101183]|uniref:hypothetical protein n=1 Tax=Kitasatospora sp. NPDC101183 TaxID=3364100 RepID=UPI00381B8491